MYIDVRLSVPKHSSVDAVGPGSLRANRSVDSDT